MLPEVRLALVLGLDRLAVVVEVLLAILEMAGMVEAQLLILVYQPFFMVAPVVLAADLIQVLKFHMMAVVVAQETTA
jgi:hypothetical protein